MKMKFLIVLVAILGTASCFHNFFRRLVPAPDLPADAACENLMKAFIDADRGTSSEKFSDYLRVPSYYQRCAAETLNRDEAIAAFSKIDYKLKAHLDKASYNYEYDLRCELTIDSEAGEVRAIFDAQPEPNLIGKYIVHRIMQKCDGRRFFFSNSYPFYTTF